MDESIYSEKTVRLPHTFWSYPADPDSLPVSALPCAEPGAPVTFGCLNKFSKVTDFVLRLWAKVLRGTAGSRLVLQVPEGQTRHRVLSLLEQEGIRAERISFISKLPHEQYLAMYRHVDIALDTIPYNGHFTSLDALWMGVPVVTLVGSTIVGRAGLSQLTNLGHPELVARSPEQFVEIATALAADKPRLATLRAALRQELQSSPMMDHKQFTHDLEAAYRQMWRTWCNAT
jgi:predicted O-linked N-acetylglucosamine transferase (SPINDLY family)